MLRCVYFISLFFFVFLKLVVFASSFPARVSFVNPMPYVSSVSGQASRVALQACPVPRASFGEPWFFRDVKDGGDDVRDMRKNDTSFLNTSDSVSFDDRNAVSGGGDLVSYEKPGPSRPRAFRGSSRGIALDALKKQDKEFEDMQDTMILLRNEMGNLQNIVREICTAMIRCDDMILLERDLLHQGSIFTSNGKTEGLLKRAPTTLRSSILNISNQYNIPLIQGRYD
jgi:hypothetical protein